MSSRYRLVALVGLVLLGAAVYAIFALMRDDTPAPNAAVEAYLADWSDGDFAAMEERVVDAPGLVRRRLPGRGRRPGRDRGGLRADVGRHRADSTGVARYSAARAARGARRVDLGRVRCPSPSDDGDWLVEWAPSNIHPDLAEGQHLARTREVPERAPILDAAGDPLSVGRPARDHRARAPGRSPTSTRSRRRSSSSSASTRPPSTRRSTPPASSPTTSSRSPPSTRPRYDQVAPVIYPLPGHPVPRHVPAGRAHPRVRRPRARPLRRDHRRAAGGARPAVPGGRPGRAERPRGAASRSSWPAPRRAPSRWSTDDGAVGGRGRAVRGRGAPAGAHDARPGRAVGGRGRPRRHDGPHGHRRGRLARATSGPSPPGRSASSTGRSPASTPPVRRSRSSPPPGCSAGASRPTRPSSARRRSTPAGARSGTSSSRASAPSPFGLAFAQSCNTAFISAAADVPDADFVAAAESFGFNTEYSVGLDTDGRQLPRRRPTPPSTRRPPSARAG